MGRILDATLAFLTDDGWTYTQSEDAPLLWTSFAGKNGSYRCVFDLRDDSEQRGVFVFYSRCPVKVQGDKRKVVAELITRLNSRLRFNYFVMNFNDGLVSCKSSVPLGDEPIPAKMIYRMVWNNVLAMDDHLPMLLSVTYGGAAPEQAIARIEALQAEQAEEDSTEDVKVSHE